MSSFKISSDNNTGILHTTYLDNTFIDPEYKKLLEGLINEDEYFYTVYTKGEWSALKLSGRVYRKFSDSNIITYEYNPHAEINVCCDFNYDPMKWALIQVENGEDIIFDEIVQNDTDTESMAKELYRRYGNTEYRIYGDYSGTARSTRRRSTDYDIIQNVLNIKRDHFFLRPNPLITTRINIVNWRLCNKMNVRKLFVDGKCEHAIKDFRRVTWVKGKKVEDQSDPENELTHISSAIGYYIAYKYSLKQIIPNKSIRTV
jgi:phage terminase large subunit